MVGMLIGTGCLIALFGTLRRHRYAHHGHGYGFGMDPGGWHRYGYEPSFEPRRGARGRLLYGLFRRLDATPGQEKALIALAEGVAQHVRDSRKELHAVRRELAAALAGDVLDPVVLDAAFAHGGELFARMSDQLKHALAQAHEVLDSEQRKLLAEWLADGSFSPRMYGLHGAHRHGC